jgi:hypothetical protein
VIFKDHFSERAALYTAYRPLYTERLFEFVAGQTRQHCEAVESHAARGDTPVVIDPSLLRRNSSLRGNSSALRRYPSAVLALALVALLVIAPRSDAQHENHTAMQDMQGDTLVTAPTTPSRPRSDSGAIADSLLGVCKPHVTHSIDAYSTCLGDGIASLSSAGNIALAMGTLDRIIHSDPSLVLLGHPLAHALGYAVRSTPATATRLLSQCDDRYQSGCYHGILQRYFDARMGMPITQSVLLAPCDGLRGTREQFRLFDCLHGTGHGLMMYHRYDVNASLKDCDRLAGGKRRSVQAQRSPQSLRRHTCSLPARVLRAAGRSHSSGGEAGLQEGKHGV